MPGGGICPHSVVTPHVGFWMRNGNWWLNLQWSPPTSTPSLLHEQTSFPSILLGISALSGFISKITSISKSSLQDCLLSKFYKSPLSQPSITFISTPNLKLQPSTKSHTLSTETQIHSSRAVLSWAIFLNRSFPKEQTAKGPKDKSKYLGPDDWGKWHLLLSF